MEKDNHVSLKSVASADVHVVDANDYPVKYSIVGQIGLILCWYLISEGALDKKKSRELSMTPLMMKHTLPFACERRVIIDRKGLTSAEYMAVRCSKRRKQFLEFSAYEDGFFSAGRNSSFKLPIHCKEFCGQTIEYWDGRPGELLSLFISLIPCISLRAPVKIAPGEFSIHFHNHSQNEHGVWKQSSRLAYHVVNPAGWPKFFKFSCVMSSWYTEEVTMCRRQWYFGDHKLGSGIGNTVVLEHYYARPGSLVQPSVPNEQIALRSVASMTNGEIADHVVALIERLNLRSGKQAVEDLFRMLDRKKLIPDVVKFFSYIDYAMFDRNISPGERRSTNDDKMEDSDDDDTDTGCDPDSVQTCLRCGQQGHSFVSCKAEKH